MQWIDLVPHLIVGTACLVLGCAIGGRQARTVRRRVLRDMNAQSIELLDTRASLNRLEQYASQQQRRDRLLKLTMRRLQQANARCRRTEERIEAEKRNSYSMVSRLRLQVVEAREMATRAAGIARQATEHLKRLEQASPATQTLEVPEPKSYGVGDPVTVSVVDQMRPDTADNAVMPVSNRDSARLTRLHSSNEASAPRV